MAETTSRIPRSIAPDLPYFVSIGPNRWEETPWAKLRCVFCPEYLAVGDKIACREHRKEMTA